MEEQKNMEQKIMKDFRGNEYLESKLWFIRKNGTKVPVGCGICVEQQAVRNCCEAEGDFGRTHWHGEIHTWGGGLKALCRKCADKENKKWNK